MDWWKPACCPSQCRAGGCSRSSSGGAPGAAAAVAMVEYTALRSSATRVWMASTQRWIPSRWLASSRRSSPVAPPPA